MWSAICHKQLKKKARYPCLHMKNSPSGNKQIPLVTRVSASQRYD